MLAWSFAARTVDEVAAVVRALSRHRYLREGEYLLHFTVLEALAEEEPYRTLARRHATFRQNDPNIDLSSRAPDLWQAVSIEEALGALSAFWTKGARSDQVRARLRRAFEQYGLSEPEHSPFESDPEEPPHPELVIVDWELLPICELDLERHRGAIQALEMAQEEVDVSAPVFQELTSISVVELCEGSRNNLIAEDLVVWSDGPYSYADYVFRGAARSAKLTAEPVGIRDLEELDE